MIEFFVKPILTGLAIVALICIGMEIDSEIYIRKSRKRREIFLEALARYHEYHCINGNQDKELKDFIREVEQERSVAHEKDSARTVYKPNPARIGN